MKYYYSIKISALLIVFVLMFNNCSKDNDEISYDLTGNWKVVYYWDNGKKITKTEGNTWPEINNGDITACFTEPDSNGKGIVSGTKVSNSYNGEYVIQNNGKISIGPITTTLINEPEWTELYHINAAQSFKIQNSMLLIFYNNGKNLIAFERN